MTNFNFSGQSEYDLNTGLIEEVISLYGIEVKFLVVTKINRDDLVFGDYSHLKSDSNKIYSLRALPEATDDWDSSGESFNPFGLTNFENISLFIAKSQLVDNIPDMLNKVSSITGNLVVLPNNKIMEITNTSWQTPGINNLFTQKDQRSVIKLSCKPYDTKLIEELNPIDISVDPNVPYTTLDSYFNELIKQTTAQDTNAEVTPSVSTVAKTGGVDTVVPKPPVDKTTSDVWGQF